MEDTVQIYLYGQEGHLGPLTLGSGRDGKFKPDAIEAISVSVWRDVSTLWIEIIDHPYDETRYCRYAPLALEAQKLYGCLHSWKIYQQDWTDHLTFEKKKNRNYVSHSK